MGTITGDYDLGGNLTLAALASQAIDTTVAGANLALFQYGSGFLRPSL
ncbi:MAG: hypothetical protein KAV68_03845 [Dehalococcoidales bacterium]|nr:hypothetical protein [Dehalococcoidales bacterium]